MYQNQAGTARSAVAACTYNPRAASYGYNPHMQKSQGQKSVSSKATVEADERMDGHDRSHALSLSAVDKSCQW